MATTSARKPRTTAPKKAPAKPRKPMSFDDWFAKAKAEIEAQDADR